MNTSLLRNYPVTITVSVIALLAWANPSLSHWLQLDFNAVSDGQWWRIWTGHLTHYDGSHLFWDLIMFVVLGGACEHRHRRSFAPAIVVIIAVISASVAVLCEQVTVYRGLSGIDTGLFVWFVADQCRDCWRSRDRVSAMLWISLSMGLIGKLLYEITTGQIFFVDASGFTPLVESHLAGAAIGSICCVGLDCKPAPKVRAAYIKVLMPTLDCGGCKLARTRGRLEKCRDKEHSESNRSRIIHVMASSRSKNRHEDRVY